MTPQVLIGLGYPRTSNPFFGSMDMSSPPTPDVSKASTVLKNLDYSQILT